MADRFRNCVSGMPPRAGVPAALIAAVFLVQAAHSADGTLVTCRDFRTGANLGVYAQQVNGAGQVPAGWVPDPSRLCAGTAREFTFSLAPDGAGGAIVAWVQSGADGTDLYAQHLTPSGDVAPGWPVAGLALCAAPRDQYGPRLVADGSGGAWACWQDYRGGRGKIFATHVTGSGARAAGWPENGSAVSPATGEQSCASAVADGAGGMIVVWQETADDSCLLHAQRLAANGDRAWGAQGVAVAGGQAGQSRPVSVADGNGGAIIVWEERSASAAPRLYAMRLDARGARAQGWAPGGVALCSATGTQRDAVIASDGASGALVAWYDARAGSGDIYAQRITGAGALAWPPAGAAVCTDAAEQYGPAILGDVAGGAFVTWEDYRNGIDGDIYVSRLTSQGAVADGWAAQGVALCDTRDIQMTPSLAADGAGGAIVTWSDSRAAGAGSFQSRSRPATPGPTLVRAEANAERARLEWQAGDDGAMTVTLMRAAGTGEWRALATLHPDPRGSLYYEDRVVTPGSQYRYRLALERGGSIQFEPEIPIDIPHQVAFALSGPRPSPTNGVLKVAFALPTSDRAMLEVIDIGGRRVGSREVGTLGPGNHVVEIPEGQRLAPGIYLLRLTQGRHVATARATVVR